MSPIDSTNPPNNQKRALRDLIVTIVLTGSMLAFAGAVDLAERFEEFADVYEQYEIDEIPFGLAICAFGLAWFAIARWLDFSRQVKETIRQRRRAEDAAIEANRANEAKTMFLANMSHEIRTPMNGVLGMINLLGETKLAPDQEKLVRSARESADALIGIINDILDISKMDAGRLKLDVTDFSPHATADAVISILCGEARAKGIELRWDPASNVPAWIKSDQLRFRQILTNLVGNAVKFTNNGGVTVGMTHRELADDKIELRCTIADTGIGIAAERIPRMFEPFTQADGSTSRMYGGTGLGLSICRQLTEMMGGQIGVDSEPNAGSTFWFTIVCDRGQTVVPAIPESAGTRPASPEDLKILLVEDNQTNRMLATAVLEKAGYAYDIAHNGIEAIEALETTAYNLILMDIQMPQMDGIEATKHIRQMPGAAGETPIVAVTANVMDGDREMYLGAGMNDYVPKPIDIGELMAAIDRNLSKGSDPINRTGTHQDQSASIANELPILDQDVIAKWQSFLSADKFSQLIDTQLAGAKDYTERLEQAAMDGAVDELRAIAHDLKGAGGNIGMARVQKLAADIEQACIDGQSAQALEKLPEVSEAFTAAASALKRYSGTSA